MSLLQDAMVDCVIMNKNKVPDGAGGFINTWTEGVKFKAAITVESTTETQIAEAQGIKRTYTVVTNQNAILDYQDVFKVVETGDIYRVKTDGNDIKTPKISTLNASQVSAERSELPS